MSLSMMGKPTSLSNTRSAKVCSQALRYGNRLRLDVTPRLRCVKEAQVLPAACEEAPVTTGT
jgi:hypothetical protein